MIVRRRRTIFLASRGWACAGEAGGGGSGLTVSGVDVGDEDMVENRRRGALDVSKRPIVEKED